MTETIKIPHQRAPSFASGIATGVSISGPSGDGMVHVKFFRDVLSVMEETFIRTDVETPSGAAAFTLTPADGGAEAQMYREDLAIMSLPVEAAKGLGNWLNTHFAQLEAK